jgi:DUF4097 and DUF4098 domain-containing protein YvlB
MITAILAGALAIGMPQQMDTTFAVQPGGTLELEAMNGAVTVDTWDRSAMRVRATHGARSGIELEQHGSTVSIEAETRGRSNPVTFEVTVPRSYSVDIEGVNLRVTVEGIQGSTTIENVQGPVTVRDVTGAVDVESVSGRITIERVRGNIEVATVNQAIRIDGVRGSIDAETSNGSIVMRAVDASAVSATTVNGLVDYDGTVHDGGRYFLAAFNGSITMAVPERTNARIDIETHNGRVESVFPVRVTGSGDREFNLTLGNGSARIELESHNGTIHLVRPRGR